MRRHRQIALRTPEQLSLQRCHGFNRDSVKTFLANYRLALSLHEYTGGSIYNMDETGFSTVPNSMGKVLAGRETRRVGMIVPQERGSLVTLALAVSESGVVIPPFFVFPTQRMQIADVFHRQCLTGYHCSSKWFKMDEKCGIC